MLLLLVSLGCGKVDSITPEAGMWSYDADSVTFLEDGCGLQTGLNFFDMLIDQIDDDGFRFIDTNGDAFTCSRGDSDFSCAALTTETTASSRAELTFVSDNAGSFLSAESLERTLTITGTCEGADCDGLFSSVTFPCATTVEMSASYDGPADALDTGFSD